MIQKSISDNGMQIDKIEYEDETVFVFDMPTMEVDSAEIIEGDVLIVAGNTQYETSIDAPENTTIETNNGMVILTVPNEED